MSAPVPTRPTVGPAEPLWRADGPDLVVHGDNLETMRRFPAGSFQLVYLDPPFNTGKVQRRQSTNVVRLDPDDDPDRLAGADPVAGTDPDPDPVPAPDPLAGPGPLVAPAPAPVAGPAEAVSTTATRTGFAGRSYAHTLGRLSEFNDDFADYWGFLEPRLVEAWRLLHDTGTLYLHLDYREAHYAKVVMDALVGRERFLNELVWAYDYGAKSRRRWPAKHETILVYVKDPDAYHFDAAAVDREPYMAPGLVTAEKQRLGKLPTDVWWHTIVSPTGAEKTGYATQKPEGILRRIVQASSREGDWVADFFGGSGTTAAVARSLGRRVVTVDDSVDALRTMRARLGADGIEYRKLQRTGSRLLSATPRRTEPTGVRR